MHCEKIYIQYMAKMLLNYGTAFLIGIAAIINAK